MSGYQQEKRERERRSLSTKAFLIAFVAALVAVFTVPGLVFAVDTADQNSQDQVVEGAVLEDALEETFAEEAISEEDATAELDGPVTKVISIVVRGAIKVTHAVVTHLDQGEAVTLSGDVYIDEDTTCGPIIVGKEGLNLIIKDGVTLTIDCTGMDNYAAIRCDDSESWLTITAGAEGDAIPQGTGKLVVHGADYCAGIGGNDTSGGRNITIESCQIYAYGGKNAAGIGGGRNHNGNNITINGGYVYAQGGEGAAGIGGGPYSAGGTFRDITINGGTVVARGGDNGGPGIGAGRAGETNGVYINENIEGVETKVYAYGSNGGAGIGNGSDYGSINQSAYNINITGGYVEAWGGDNENHKGGAGIGGGAGLKGYDINITGGTVKAYAGGEAAAIGGGYHDDGYDITISGGTVEAYAYTSSSDANVNEGAGIGGGKDGKGYRITIEGGTVTAASRNGAGIGGGNNGKLEKKEFGVRITGGTVTATSVNGAGIGGGSGRGGDGTITISGTDTRVYATATGAGAGIGGGKDGDSHVITISEGYVEATSTGTGAGIGSGAGGKAAENINIEGGYILATGGGDKDSFDTAKDNNSGCGIGCGAGTKYKITAVYINTALNYEYKQDGEWKSAGPYSGNWVNATDNNCNKSQWRQVRIAKGDGKTIELGEQQGVPTYGDDRTTTTYSLTTKYISGNEWSMEWYKDGVKCMPPVFFFDVSDDMKTLELTYRREGDAGEYTFTLSCDDKTSDPTTYTVNKRPATITSGSATKVYDGTPLTCETYETSGFVEGQGVDVTCTGSCTGSADQTAPTTADNEFTYEAQDGTNLDNYDITKAYGTLTVVKQLFVVTAGNFSAKYDGNEHQFNDASNGTAVKVTAKNGVDCTSVATLKYATSNTGEEGSWSDWTTSVPSITNAGTLYVKVQASATVGSKTATIESDVYTMEVTTRDVVLTSASKTQEYTGNALTNDEVTVSGDGFAQDEGATYNVTGNITKAGTTSNSFTYTLNNDTKADNYTISQVVGTLTVTPKAAPITITTPSDTKTYDGEVLSAGEATWTDGVLVSGDTLTVTLAKTGDNAVKDAGTYDNSIESYQVMRGDEDVTDCYTFAEPVIGELVIDQQPLTLTSGSDLKIWTQEGDSAYNDTVDAKGLIDGEVLTYSDFPTVTEISYTPTANTFTYAAADGSAFNADNYDVTVNTGYLMLVEEMAIVGEDQTFTYDGTAHKAPVTLVDNGQGASVTITYSTSTDGKTWTSYASTEPTITDAGTLYIKAKATKGVQVKEASYTATVNKRNVLLTSGSASQPYDGNALTCGTVADSGDGFVQGEGATYDVTGTQTDVGSSENSFSYSLKSNTNEDNYVITTKFGTLEVTANVNTITIESGSATQAYNGMPLTDSNYTITWNGTAVENGATLCGNDVINVVSANSITNVGSVDNEFTYTITRNGVDVSKNYTVAQPVYGTLTVEPRSIVITTGSSAKLYDGTALTCDQYAVTGDGFVSGEGITVTVAGTRTNAGTSNNTCTYTFNEGTTVGNYEVTVEFGTLTVSKRSVTVTSGSAVKTESAVRDSGAATNDDIQVSGDGFVDGELQEDYPMATGSQSDLGKSDNTIDIQWTQTGNPANYDITENLGTLMVVSDSECAATATGYEGVYDGEAHGGVVTPAIDGATIQYYVDGSEEPVTENPTFTNAGEYSIKALVSSGANSCTVSYAVKISPRQVTISTGSASKTYDGTELTCEQYAVTGDGFVYGEGFDKVSFVGARTNAGTSDNELDSLIPYTFKEGTLADNYQVTVEPGTLTVNKRSVTVTSGSAVKTESAVTATGAATSAEIQISGDEFISGELQEGYPKATGSQSVLGGSENTIELAWNDGFSEDNYAITKIPGTLKVVSDDECAATATDYEGIYDGKAHGGVVTPGIEGATIEYYVDESSTDENANPVTENPTFTDVGEHSIDAVVSSGENKCLVTYTVKITKRQVTISTGSASKTYDGTALTCNESTTEGFVSGEGVTVTVTGQQTNADSSENTFTCVPTGNTKLEDNYEIEEQLGTLTVNKRSVTVTSGNAVKTESAVEKTGPADNDAITVSSDGFVVGELQTGYPKATGSQSNLGYSDNTIELEWNEGFSADNYAITENPGTLMVVSDSECAATATGYEGIYDGKAHGGVVTPAIEGATIVYYVDKSDNPVTDNPTFTDAGEHFIRAVVSSGANSCTVSYAIKISQRSLVLTAGSATKVYDGEALTCDTYTIGGAGFANDTEAAAANVQMTDASTITNAGTQENSFVELADTDTFKTSNYDISCTAGTLTVSKRSVVLISKSYGYTVDEIVAMGATEEFAEAVATGAKKYTGEAQMREEVIEVGKMSTSSVLQAADGMGSVEGMGFVQDEGATFTGWKSFTDAGTYANTFTYTLDSGTQADNYNISCQYGNVKILPRELTLTSANASKVYDGTSLTNDTVTVGGDGFVQGEGATYEVTGSQTEVGKSNNTFTYALSENTKASNYNIACTEGTLEVYDNGTLRVVVPDNKEYIYDGQPHGEEAQAFIGDEPATEDVIWYSTDGGETFTDEAPQRTEVGTTEVQVRVEKEGYTTATGSYTITVKAVLDATGYEGVYDGQEHSGVVDTIWQGVTFEYKYDGKTSSTNPKFKDVGKHDVEVTATDGAGNTATCSYTVNITKRSLTLTSGNASKMYDGTALTCDQVTVGGDGFVENESATYTMTGSQTTVGTSKNTFSYTLKNKAKADNYNITCVEGTLEVYDNNTLHIVVPDNKDYTYDGKPHGDEPQVFIGDELVDEVIWYSTDGGETYTTEVPQRTEVGTTEVLVRVEKEGYTTATGSYTITVKAASDKPNSVVASTGDSLPVVPLAVLVVATIVALCAAVRARRSKQL